MSKPLYKLMNQYDLKTQGQINSSISALAAFDENVVSDEDYLLIKDRDINKKMDMEYISDILLKPWFMEHAPEQRNEMIQSIDHIFTHNGNLVDMVLMNTDFIFDNEIEDKRGFLLKVKELLEKYMHEAGSTDSQA